MLPTGHIAGGYLVAKAVLAIAHPALSVADQEHLIWWTMFFSFAPDLDMFIMFFKLKKFRGEHGHNHRTSWFHAPVLWLVAGLILSLIGWGMSRTFIEYLGLLLWLGSWSHFVFDSIQDGIMWRWPFSSEFVPLVGTMPDHNAPHPTGGFFSYWSGAVKSYAVTEPWPFYLEFILIISALVVFFR